MIRIWRGPQQQRRLARKLRRERTPAEEALFCAFQAAKLMVRVRDQHPLFGYVADFYVPSANLAIEVDGGIHEETRERDEQRDAHLLVHGVTVVRFTNEEVLADAAAVVRQVRERLGI